MNKVSLLLLITLVSCTQSRINDKSVKEDSVRYVKNYLQTQKQEDSLYAAQSSFFRERFLKVLKLPDLRKTNHEAYILYIANPPFAQPDFVFCIEQTAPHQFRLMSRFFIMHDTAERPWHFNWNCTDINITRDTVLEALDNMVSEEDWYTFKVLLQGSYHWAFENPCPRGTGILDGEYFILESKAIQCADDEMTYHRTTVHCPRYGSFLDACLFLVSRSKLAEECGLNEYYGKRYSGKFKLGKP